MGSSQVAKDTGEAGGHWGGHHSALRAVIMSASFPLEAVGIWIWLPPAQFPRQPESVEI